MTDPAPAWTLRPYRAGDEHALVELFGRVFGRQISVEHWRWKLKSHPSPAENVWLAAAADRPIFQYAGIPLRFQTPAGETTAMVSVDTMTDPGFRRRGLLTSVGGHAYQCWRRAGVGFVLGLPNDKWGSRTGALNWEALFGLRWLIRPLRPEAIAARRVGRAARGLAALGGLWNIAWDRRLAADPGLSIRMVGR
ncbi:MAG TPA: GNAT family N-acetyltransferase, partial [Herpetosiphonaceae bacterium]|nr:GNAT family N-acetyltransferase [Herpetosiphonaceae bacterium]